MSKRMLVEVHVGKRYGISRLNCDGAGQVKDVIIDNERYNRISSQSKKKVWRENLEKRLERLNGDSMEHVYRTRAMKDIFKKEFLKKESELYAENADAMAEYIIKSVLSCTLEEKNGFDVTNQVLIVTKYDVEDIVEVFCDVIKTPEDWEQAKKEAAEKEKEKENDKKKGGKAKSSAKNSASQRIISALKAKLPLRKYGVECSLFGRMATSGVMETVESAMCVNHSYSLGKATLDSDYYIVVDNYLSAMASETESGQSGAGYLDEKEFSSHVYYEYASIDVGKFYDNLTKGVDMSDEKNVQRIKTIIIEAVKCVINDIATSAPSGGQNSFASRPDPVGVYITIKEGGEGRTADTYCIKEMVKKGSAAAKTEADKFLNAMNEFTSGDFADDSDYLARIYAGESPEMLNGAEHMSWKEAVKKVGDAIDEKF